MLTRSLISGTKLLFLQQGHLNMRKNHQEVQNYVDEKIDKANPSDCPILAKFLLQ